MGHQANDKDHNGRVDSADVARDALTLGGVDPSQYAQLPVEEADLAFNPVSDTYVADAGGINDLAEQMYANANYGTIKLDPAQDYSNEPEIYLRPGITLDGGGQVIGADGDHDVVNIAPNAQLKNATVSGLSAPTSEIVNLSNDKWSDYSRIDETREGNDRFHIALNPGSGTIARWEVRPPAHNLYIFGSDTAEASGSRAACLTMQNSGGNTAFQLISNIYCWRHDVGVKLVADDATPDVEDDSGAFTNGVQMTNIACDGNLWANWWHTGTDPDVNANTFYNVQFQAREYPSEHPTQHGIVIDTGGYNDWHGHIWDLGKYDGHVMWIRNPTGDGVVEPGNIVHMTGKGLANRVPDVRNDPGVSMCGIQDTTRTFHGTVPGDTNYDTAEFMGIGTLRGSILGARNAVDPSSLPDDSIQLARAAGAESIRLAARGIDYQGNPNDWVYSLGDEDTPVSGQHTTAGNAYNQRVLQREGGVTMTLASADCAPQTTITVVDVDGNAAADPMTIDCEGTETISGQASLTLDTDYEWVRLQPDESQDNWLVVGRGTPSGGGATVVASGTVTLSSGSGAVDTGVSADTGYHYDLRLSPQSAGDVAGSLEHNGTSYTVRVEENTTSNNPDVAYELVRS